MVEIDQAGDRHHGEIASASRERPTGIEQINTAVAQMDEVTQQNSALVEENAATARTLEQQAESMREQVAFFQIDAAAASASERLATVHTKAQSPAPVLARPPIAAQLMPGQSGRSSLICNIWTGRVMCTAVHELESAPDDAAE